MLDDFAKRINPRYTICMYMKKIYYFIFFLLAIGLASWLFVNRVEIKQDIADWQRKRDLPVATVKVENVQNVQDEQIEQSVETGDSSTSSAETADFAQNDENSLSTEINLAVPFISQAPYAVWDGLHEDACEEAAMIMLNAFYQGVQKISKEEAEQAIQNLVKWEKENLGFFESTNAEENVRILKEYFGLSGARAIYDITIEDIKKELAESRPVLVPAAGKLLPNPYFRNGGPLFHMLLIKGYAKDGRFITNDPGTKRGEDFTYKFEDLFNAIHDWNGGEVVEGRKVILIVAF